MSREVDGKENKTIGFTDIQCLIGHVSIQLEIVQENSIVFNRLRKSGQRQ